MRSPRYGGPRRRRLSLIAALLWLCSWQDANSQDAITIEQLLSEGWEIAGYVSAWENRSLILFRNKDRNYLVQCSILIDALRSPRVVTYCYSLK
jgi:hypothetical protein